MQLKKSILFIVLSLSMGACATYTLPVESLTTQLQSAPYDPNKSVSTNLAGSMIMGNFSYQANALDTLQVYNSKGNIVKLKNAPSIEMQLTLKNGRKATYYFDTVIIQNDSLKGCYSRFLNKYRLVAIKDIESITVQNAKKSFNYAK